LIIFPAIDLRRGRVVRLRQGDPAAQTVYGDDPAAIARRWAGQGAEWLHVVNLDGAFSGGQGKERHSAARSDEASQGLVRGEQDSSLPPVAQNDSRGGDLSLSLDLDLDLNLNLKRLAEIRAAVSLPIQFGGGIRTVDDVARALALGATRVVLGTVAVRQPQVVAQAVARFGAARIVVGIDARDGMVATHGWQEMSALDARAVARRMAGLGVLRIIFTDIARDGTLTGVNMAATAALARESGLKIIASGGVASLADIRALAAHAPDGIEGVIVGQALYAGAIALPEVIALAR
jgi:phosphoribosylformimino-5-aminoimidazole carboxamide ribotide isomerase